MKIILLNGPAESGKDTFANIIQKNYGVANTKLAYHMKESISTFFMLTYERLDELDNNHKLKETPLPELGNRSFREICIAFAETFAKPLFGNDWFAKQTVNDIKKSYFFSEFCVSDIRRKEEVTEFLNNFEKDDILLVKIYRTGYTFANDSGGYVDTTDLNINEINLYNTDYDKYINDLCKITEDFLIK